MNKYLKCFTVIVSILTIALLSACGHHETSINAHESNKEVKVEVTRPDLRPYEDKYTLSGNIKARHKANLSTNVMGYILELVVDEGSQVKAGELLGRIDDNDTKLKVANAKAEEFKLKSVQEELNAEFEELKNRIQMLFHDQEKYLAEAELAQSTFDRYSKLLEKDVATQQEYDEAKLKLDQANSIVAKSQAEFNMLMAKKKQLEAKAKQISASMEQNNVKMADAMAKDIYTKIVSPFDGVVTIKYKSVGDMSVPGEPIITVEDPRFLYLELNVDESQAPMFQQGAEAGIIIDAYNGQTKGIISEVVPASDPDSHTVKVKIDIAPHDLIHSGMYARVVIPQSGENYFVPRMAIITKGQVKGVFVVDKKNIARFRILKTGQEILGFVEVLSSLDKDDKVIISRLDEINDGTKVIILGE